MEMFLKRLSEKYFLADYKRPPFRVRDGVFYTGNGKELFAYRNSLYFSDKKVQDLNRQILVLCLVITGLIFPIGFVARQLFSTAAILIVMILLLGVVAFAFSAKNIWLRSKVRNGAKLYKSFEKSEFRSYSLSQVVIESSVPFWMVAVEAILPGGAGGREDPRVPQRALFIGEQIGAHAVERTPRPAEIAEEHEPLRASQRRLHATHRRGPGEEPLGLLERGAEVPAIVETWAEARRGGGCVRPAATAR